MGFFAKLDGFKLTEHLTFGLLYLATERTWLCLFEDYRALIFKTIVIRIYELVLDMFDTVIVAIQVVDVKLVLLLEFFLGTLLSSFSFNYTVPVN